MKNLFLPCGILFALSLVLSKGGVVVTLGDGTESTGKTSLTASAVHVDGAPNPDVDLGDVLEANFSDAPLKLSYYSSSDGDGAKLPEDWKPQDIGHFDTASTFSFADHTFTVTSQGSAVDKKEDGDQLFFVGAPWTGNGEWTVHIREMKPQDQPSEAGLMIRDSLDPTAPMFGLGATGSPRDNGQFHYRHKAGEHPGWGGDFQLDLPIYLRLTRHGTGIDGSVSTDGKIWQNIAHYETEVGATPLVGLFANSRNDKTPGTVIMDQVTFTQPPSVSEVVPPGLFLRSGSFVAGAMREMKFDPSHTDATGRFSRGDATAQVMPSQISAVVMSPIPRSVLTSQGSQAGLLVKNGDFLAGKFESISDYEIQMNSETLGSEKYKPSQIGACVLNPLDPQIPAGDYEVRLRDGSVIFANSFGVNNGKLAVGDTTGLNIEASQDDIAQVRAGPAKALDLFNTPWKATPLTPPKPAEAAPTPPVATVTAATTNAAPATNGATATPPANPAPAAAPAPPAAPAIQVTTGPNQEQIMATPTGTFIEFPLKGKFRAMGVRVALSADSPAHATASVRFVVNGREVTRTPPFKAGDPSRFMEVTLQNPQSVGFVVNSTYPGVRVLLIDPVAVRDVSQ